MSLRSPFACGLFDCEDFPPKKNYPTKYSHEAVPTAIVDSRNNTKTRVKKTDRGWREHRFMQATLSELE